jgi:hypothetical protein
MLVYGCTFELQKLYESMKVVTYSVLLRDIFLHKRCCSSLSVGFLQFTGHVARLRISMPHISPTLASLERLVTTYTRAQSRSPRVTPIFVRYEKNVFLANRNFLSCVVSDVSNCGL